MPKAALTNLSNLSGFCRGFVRLLPLVVACVALVGTTACTTTSTGKKAPPPVPRFYMLETVPLSASALNVRVVPEVETAALENFPQPPSTLVKAYLERRFAAAGTAQDGTIQFLVPEIRVSYGPTAAEQNFWEKKSWRAGMEMDFNMTYRTVDGSSKTITLNLSRTKTIFEDMSIEQREREMQYLVEEVIADLDKAINDRLGLLMAYYPQE